MSHSQSQQFDCINQTPYGPRLVLHLVSVLALCLLLHLSLNFAHQEHPLDCHLCKKATKKSGSKMPPKKAILFAVITFHTHLSPNPSLVPRPHPLMRRNVSRREARLGWAQDYPDPTSATLSGSTRGVGTRSYSTGVCFKSDWLG